MQSDLVGRNIFVTGGSGAIGGAICLDLAAKGARVGLGYKHNREQAEGIQRVANSRGGIVEIHQLDVSNPVSVETALGDFCQKSEGKLEGLVNSAGINKPADFDKLTDASWAEILDINLVGPFRVSKASLPYLKSSHDPTVVHIGSVSGQIGGPRTAHYAASKAGLSAFSQVLARFGTQFGIRSNVVSPGYISSDMASVGSMDPRVLTMIESIPMGRLGGLEEVAEAVSFLSSSASSYITGQSLNVNGGLFLS